MEGYFADFWVLRISRRLHGISRLDGNEQYTVQHIVVKQCDLALSTEMFERAPGVAGKVHGSESLEAHGTFIFLALLVFKIMNR